MKEHCGNCKYCLLWDYSCGLYCVLKNKYINDTDEACEEFENERK